MKKPAIIRLNMGYRTWEVGSLDVVNIERNLEVAAYNIYRAGDKEDEPSTIVVPGEAPHHVDCEYYE